MSLSWTKFALQLNCFHVSLSVISHMCVQMWPYVTDKTTFKKRRMYMWFEISNQVAIKSSKFYF